MTRRWPRVVLSLCLLVGVAACQPESAGSDDPAAPAEVPFGQGRLWRIDKPGNEASYVFATISLIDSRLCDLAPSVWQAFNTTQRAAFEVVPTPATEAFLAEAVKLPASMTLEDILGAELFRRSLAAVTVFGVEESTLQKSQPWLLASMLSISPVEAARQSKGTVVLDVWLQHRARRQGKEVVRLWTWEEIVAFYDSMSERDKVALVANQLTAFAEIDAATQRRAAAYLEGDLAGLRAEAKDLSHSSDAEAAARFNRWLIEDRSLQLVERMLPMLDGVPTFFSVSSILLPGEQGVLRLLEREGYTLTRLD